MSNTKKIEMVTCFVKNCQRVIPKEKAIVIEGNYYCEDCGVAYYRTLLGI